ncbi:alpha/beta hydrolase [Hymenobacter sp. RP-2-7]|uniref:Alpha/beta hydrolase n=1 Tax=Hymenobacter polaris TaxID=2682546 RepID=A0A7Y0AIE9_9BACT|nr:alpha/beta hydrolase [Hymenobacter polaris]NML67670.1 alpha/beta hydrolase [Hymenobacter polaris]
MDTTAILQRSNVTISGLTDPGAPTIVFLHGLGADQSSWRLLAPAFEANYRVVLLDLIGAGNSSPEAYDYARHGSLHGHADDLLDVLRALAATDVVFVGHSISSIIGVLAAVREPARFGRLVLLAPSPRFVNEGGYAGGFAKKDIEELLTAMEQNYEGWIGGVAPLMMGSSNTALIAELSNSFMRTNPTIAQHFARTTFLSDHRADLPLLTTPTLILQCAHDVIAPLAVGTYLHEHLPDSQLVVIDTPGHCAHLTAPSQTLEEMDDFLHYVPCCAGMVGQPL